MTTGTTTDSDDSTDPLDALQSAKAEAEHYAAQAADDPAVPDRYAGAFERIAESHSASGGAVITVGAETHERLDHAAVGEESHDDVISRLLSAVPGPNEWTCRHCGDDICAPQRHHETNDLVLWQLQVEDAAHYRPDPFCSQRWFREHVDELLGDTEGDR